MNKRLPIKLILILAGLLCVGIIVFLAIQSQQFRVVSTIPSLTGEVPTSTGNIKLTFSKKLDKAPEYTDFLEGNIRIIDDFQVVDNTILIKLGPLDEDKRYSFVIRKVRAESGEVIDRIPVNFTAVYVPYNKLPKAQQELELNETDKDNSEDPIQAVLPHEGDRFYLDGEFTSDDDGETIFVLTGQLFLTRADLGANRQTAIDQYKKRVEDFIRSNGLDPGKYLIRYTINEPPSVTN